METRRGPRRRTAMARKLDDAFAGCESWDLVPPRRNRAPSPLQQGVAAPIALAQAENSLLGQPRRA